MQQLISQHNKKNSIELTGNPFVDTGIAVIAALNDCSAIEDLTLRKMKNVHGNGTKLARNNMRLRSNYMVFVNSVSMNPIVKDSNLRAKNYAKITTAILNNIGHEEIHELCDFCGNQDSVDLDKLFHRAFRDKKKDKKKKTKKKTDKNLKEHYIGRDWFPLAGSIGSDAQALPGGSRSLNICAKCLFAVQYLPQGVILIKGLLTIFQSTSTTFWYQWVKSLVKDISSRLSVRSEDKIETIGKKEGSGVAVNRLLAIMKSGIRVDPNTSLTMWLFSNLGNKADCQLDTIPNFSLNFLHKAAKYGLDSEIKGLMVKDKEKKTSFKKSFLNCITKKLDYLPLYPSKKFSREGATLELFLLYQTHIRNYPAKTLHTAYKIAQYVKSKIDPEKDKGLGIDIHREIKKQNTVKKRIIEMAEGGSVTFDEYYDLFVVPHLGNPWQLIRYYMLSDIADFKTIEEEADNDKLNNNQEYKNRVITIGTAIFNSYIERRGRERLIRDVLGGLAHGRIHANWLRNQFKRLAEENEDFDYDANWKALCINKQGEESVYEVLYLFRLLFTTLL
jgi:hypothetical protein